MSRENVPVVAIRRSDRGDLSKLLYPVRTRSLLNKGARVLFTGGTAGATPDADNVVHDLHEVVTCRAGEDPVVIRTAGSLAVGSVLNTYRPDNNPPTLPTLNDIRVRTVSGKDRIYALVPDISPKTVIAKSVAAAKVAQDELSAAGGLVIKPVRGMRGRGVQTVAHSQLEEELARRFAENSDDVQVVQERIAKHPWPRTIHAADPEEEARLHGAKSQELRMFLVNGLYVPIARVIDPTDDKEFNHPGDAYVALDADTVPFEAYAMSADIATKVRQESGVDELAVAADFMYGERPSSAYGQPGWYLAEVNSIDPQMPSVDQYPQLGWELNDARSDQLIRMASTSLS